MRVVLEERGGGGRGTQCRLIFRSTFPARERCRQLSLSTNQIDRMFPLTGMRKLRILSLGRNLIKKIEKLDDVADTLEELWLSYNQITSLDGLQGLPRLSVLYLSNNSIRDWNELEKLVGGCVCLHAP